MTKYPYEEWFAWHPVQLEDGSYRWLTKVFRRGQERYLKYFYISYADGVIGQLTFVPKMRHRSAPATTPAKKKTTKK